MDNNNSHHFTFNALDSNHFFLVHHLKPYYARPILSAYSITMSFLVPEEQWSTVAVGSVHADYYSSFLNYISHKVHATEISRCIHNMTADTTFRSFVDFDSAISTRMDGKENSTMP